jgi:tRNA-Thr(GGU) m(6)t(6)A37 methyltransferase TsaA
MKWSFEPIGIIHTACKEKFGLPRQSGLVPSLTGDIEIFSPYDTDEAFQELKSFSHIWVISVFHLTTKNNWQPTVRPPRLGGNRRVGVFASRAPYRPNPVGLSVFQLLDIVRVANKLLVKIAGTDLVEGTPVLDIKPYLPYADNIRSANGGYTDEFSRVELSVRFDAAASAQCDALESGNYPGLRSLVTGLLAQDPRPAYRNSSDKSEYGMQLYDLNVRFRVEQGEVVVTGLETGNLK